MGSRPYARESSGVGEVCAVRSRARIHCQSAGFDRTLCTRGELTDCLGKTTRHPEQGEGSVSLEYALIRNPSLHYSTPLAITAPCIPTPSRLRWRIAARRPLRM